MRDQTDATTAADPMHGEILPPTARSRPDANAARTLVGRLTVSGPAGEGVRFRAAAGGTSGIPWHLDLDLDHEEPRLLAPMAGQGPEAWALARELREVIAARHDRCSPAGTRRAAARSICTV